jgi:drug/metabolite transporter (DMT)-like permease
MTALAYVFLCIVWGSTYIGIHVIVQSMSPFWFGGIRFVVCSILMLAACEIVRAPRPKRWGPILVMAFLFLGVGNGALCWASQFVKGGIASIVSPLSPLLVASLMALLPRGERLRPLGWIGLFLGFAGVALLVQDWSASWGEMVLLVSVVGWSTGTVYSRFVNAQYHSLTLTAYQMLFGGLMLLGLAAFEGPVFHAEPTPLTWWALGYMIVFGGCLAFLAFTYLIQKMPATKAQTYGYVNPAVALLIGWGWAGETYTWRELLGSAVIVGAVILVHRSKVTTISRS